MGKPTDVYPKKTALYFLPVEARVPLKFGPETLTHVTCARVRMRVEDTFGNAAEGWGETPLSVQWVWPSSTADGYKTVVAAVGPQNPRNSEVAIIALKDGSLLLAWTDFYAGNGADHGPARIAGRISKDAGKTWGAAKQVSGPGKYTGLGGQYQSFSSDGGETWTKPEPSALKGSAAPVSISRILGTGDLLAVWNHNPGSGNRNPLTSAISKDEGATWEAFRNIEDAPDDMWAYPAVTWVGDNALLTYFNYTGGLSLQLRILPAQWFYGK